MKFPYLTLWSVIFFPTSHIILPLWLFFILVIVEGLSFLLPHANTAMLDTVCRLHS